MGRRISIKTGRSSALPWPLLFFIGLGLWAASGQALAAEEPLEGNDTLLAADRQSPEAEPSSEEWSLWGDDGRSEAIRYQGQRIEYLVDRDLIQLTGQARVRYGHIRVEGDSIVFDTHRLVLTVSQDPVLYDREEAIYGQRMIYDFRRRRGWIYGGFTKFDRGRYWGRRIRQVGERTLNVDYGRYTTCDAQDPHYYFWARRMKIYLDDKLVAQPVALCFSGVPFLVVPFWILPLRHDRHSGFLMPRFGTSAYEGVYVKNLAYYQVIDQRSDVTLSGDYLEFIGWRGNLEGRFVDRRLSANGNFSYLEDRKVWQRRWSLHAEYDHRLGRRTHLSGRADMLSDRQYYTDFSDDLNVRLNRNLRSYLAAHHSWSNGSLSAAADRSDNLDLETKSLRLPEATLVLYRKDLPGRVAGISGSSYFINTDNRSPLWHQSHKGWDNSAEISSSFTLLHVSLTPRASFRATWYDRDTSGQRNALRWLYRGGISAGTTLYGLLPVGRGPLGGLRHVVQPGVSYSFAPKIDQGRYPVFGSIGRMGEQKSLGASLSQVLQAKFRQGERSRKIDLLSVHSSASCNLLATSNRWSGLSSTATLLPGNSIFDVRLSHYYDVYRKRSEYVNLDANIRFSGSFGQGKASRPESMPEDSSRSADSLGRGERAKAADTLSAVSDDGAAPDSAGSPKAVGLPVAGRGLPWYLSFGLSQGWRAGQGVVQSLIRGSIEANITKNWKINYSQYYDLRQREMVSQSYSLYRDLHCWEAHFSSTKSGLYWFYEFRINLKAIPDIKLQIPKSGRVNY